MRAGAPATICLKDSLWGRYGASAPPKKSYRPADLRSAMASILSPCKAPGRAVLALPELFLKRRRNSLTASDLSRRHEGLQRAEQKTTEVPRLRTGKGFSAISIAARQGGVPVSRFDNSPPGLSFQCVSSALAFASGEQPRGCRSPPSALDPSLGRVRGPKMGFLLAKLLGGGLGRRSLPQGACLRPEAFQPERPPAFFYASRTW